MNSTRRDVLSSLHECSKPGRRFASCFVCSCTDLFSLRLHSVGVFYLLCGSFLGTDMGLPELLDLPLYFQARGASALMSGILLIPYSFGGSILAAVSGQVISRTGKYRPMMWFGFVIMTLGTGLMINLDGNSSRYVWRASLDWSYRLRFAYHGLLLVRRRSFTNSSPQLELALFS